MCGIAGFFSLTKPLPENANSILENMGNIQSHRGPDDSGTKVFPHCGFSFRRLSIIDLASGQQPMLSPSKNSAIVFNGEIYNYRELRKELEAKGEQFCTNSDTEVILVGYEVWGTGIVSKIRGMFAFAIYDLQNRSLFLARDHTGIKPLYYCQYEDYFIFASEAKALFEFPGLPAEFNLEMLPQHMSFLWVPAPNTMFKNIFVLEPGHSLTLDRNGLHKKCYWEIPLSSPDYQKREKDWTGELDAELRRCVEEQMISDVPLGAFLSGGVDSSSVIAYMNQITNNKITSYTTGFPAEDLAEDVILSDIQFARMASKSLSVDYNELILSPNIAELLPKLAWHMDEPVADPAAITTYLICKASKEKATVMLSGVGGDEIFGGYPRYLANLIAERYLKIPKVMRYLIKGTIQKFPAGKIRFFRSAHKFLKSADFDFQKRYFGYLTYYGESELKSLLRDDFAWDNVFATHHKFMTTYESLNPLQKMMNLDVKTFLPHLNLMYTDKMSSAASVEVRVPFLDHLLIEKVTQIPDDLKIKGSTRKYLLKKTVEGYLPKDVVWRKKAGFGAPIGAWLKGRLKEMMLDLLSEETTQKRGYFSYPHVAKIIDGHLSGREYNANQLWQLMMLELWHQTYLD